VLAGHDDAVDPLTGCRKVRSYPAHVTRDLSHDAVGGMAAFDSTTTKSFVEVSGAQKVQAADWRGQLMFADSISAPRFLVGGPSRPCSSCRGGTLQGRREVSARVSSKR
jgi:hypothetical protein